MGLYVMLAHPVKKLPWNLHKRLFGQQMWIVLEVVEWDELHDVSSHVLPVGARVKCLIITIKRLHRLEISVTYTDDNDGKGVLRATNDLVDRLVHVADDTIGDDGQNVEFLVHLSHTV